MINGKWLINLANKKEEDKIEEDNKIKKKTKKKKKSKNKEAI